MSATKRTREEWAVLLEEMRASGLAQTEWCKSRHINYKTMRNMKGKIENGVKIAGQPRQIPIEAKGVAPQFIKLPVIGAEGKATTDISNKSPSITITVKDGIICVGIYP